MPKMIIGIHGLSNKPPKAQLKDWWLRAINDGLERAGGRRIGEEAFDLAYWADLRYKQPDPNPQPYSDPGTDEPGEDPNALVLSLRNAFTGALGGLARKIDSIKDQGRIDDLKNALRKKVAEDLGDYLDSEDQVKFGGRRGAPTRAAIRDTFKDLLADHRDKEILVIAHSMGSIVAYDVLRDIEATTQTVQHFVTIGSPLALEDVKGRICEERGEKTPLVPLSIRESWRNYADHRDLVAADLTVRGEYENSRDINLEDTVVQNGYRFRNNEGQWEHNYHKSYGYLRTPELSENLKAFLGS